MRPVLTLILLTLALTSMATTYTVTSNADSGPGTLRDAIQQAAANSASGPNLIVFNIADQSQAGRTITIQSMLPLLSSNLTIDGTTQPGPAFGISNARVIITNLFSYPYRYYFEMLGVTNVQIYGLYLQGVTAGYAIHFRGCSNLQFGAPGKGNIITGFIMAFFCDLIYGSDPSSTNVVIQSNFLGTDPTGMNAIFNEIDFGFTNVANVQIGGLNPGEGNLMVESNHPMDYNWTRKEKSGYLNIQGNLQGTDITGNRGLSLTKKAFVIDGYSNGSGDFTSGSDLSVNIINNLAIGGFHLENLASPFKIQGNRIGVGADNVTNLSNGSSLVKSYLLSFGFCGGGLIGGPNPADKNYLAYNQVGVDEFWCGNITISRNSFFCNDLGIELNWSLLNRPAPFVTINLLNTGMVGGTALPNSIIELFYDDECPGCEGKTYIGSTTADNNGNWTYTLTATGAIVATATDTYGATSAFSIATINTANIVLTNASCGRANGSIKNIQVSSGTEWYWQDAQGNIVANSVDLNNVGPGTYTFVSSIGGASCSSSSTPYTITNIDLPNFDPTAISITQPTCGQNNGALQYAGKFDDSTSYSWSMAGTTITTDFSKDNPLNNLAPGAYNLKLALRMDPTCMVQYGPYNLVNQTGPTLSTTNAFVTTSTCGQSNGSLTGVTYQNAVQPIYIAWQDSLGKIVGNNLDLNNSYAGKYRLAFKDAGGCDTIFTNWYTIPDEGSISYDTSKMIVTTASCETPNGSITGIQSTNASSFIWNNINSNTMVGSTEDLTQIGGGSYQLTMTNTIGCKAQTPVLYVNQIPKPAIDYSSMKIENDTCNTGLGSILGLKMADPLRTYSWNWYDLGQNNSNPGGSVVGTKAGYLDSIKSGNYEVAVKDQYGCSVTSNVLSLTNIEFNPPAPAVSDQYIPRNTSTIIKVNNWQNGNYKLLDSDMPGANILDLSSAGILHTPTISQDERLYVMYSRGDCSSIFSPVNIKVFDSVRIFVPDAFTPNNDGINDYWHITVQGLVVRIHITVFNRWGEMVFSSDNPGMTWDGQFKGQPLSGSFVYFIEGKDYYRPFQLKGTLLIIR